MTIDPGVLREATAALREANLAFARRYPGESGDPQPVHTLIEGAQHFTADVATRRGAQALSTDRRGAGIGAGSWTTIRSAR